jgi:hypothetical protein
MALNLDEITQLYQPAQYQPLELSLPELMGGASLQPESPFKLLPQPAQQQQIPDRLTTDAVKDDMATYIKSLAEKAGAGSTAPATTKGMVRAGETVKTTEGGLTPLQQAQSLAVTGKAALQESGIDAERSRTNASLYEAEAARLRAEASIENEKRMQQEQEQETRAQRYRDQQAFLLEQKDEPPSADRYYEKVGTLSKMAAIASAFAFGYFNPRGGTAPVVQTMQRMAAEDVRDQMAAAAQNKARRQDLVAFYEQRFGDTQLVAKKLEADKLRTLEKTLRADALQAKSQEAKANYEDLSAKLGVRADVLDQQVTDALVAKPVAERTTTFRPAGGGAVDPVERAKKTAEAAKALEAAGVGKEAIAALFQSQGLEAPTAQTAAEREAAEKAAKARELTTDEKKDLREKTDGIASAIQGFEELDKQMRIKRRADDGEVVTSRPDASEILAPSDLAGGAANMASGVAKALPWRAGDSASAALDRTLPDDHKAVKRAAQKITDGVMRAESGAGVNVAEMEDYRSRLPTNGGTETFMRSSAEMRRELTQKYKNLVGQYGKAAADEYLRAKGVDVKAMFGDYNP